MGCTMKQTKKYWISYNEDFQLKTDLPYIIHWADCMSTDKKTQNIELKMEYMTKCQWFLKNLTKCHTFGIGTHLVLIVVNNLK